MAEYHEKNNVCAKIILDNNSKHALIIYKEGNIKQPYNIGYIWWFLLLLIEVKGTKYIKY